MKRENKKGKVLFYGNSYTVMALVDMSATLSENHTQNVSEIQLFGQLSLATYSI